MRSFYLLAALVFAAGCGHKNPPTPMPDEAGQTTFEAADGKKVYADLYVPKKVVPKGVVLMFHQAGSSAAEYYPIAPRVMKLGFACLAVDQRSGGEMYGPNRTAAEDSGEKGYMAAYADIEGALAWAQKKGFKQIIAWGSSYSASFTFRLASEHKEVSAIIAFSPGEYFDDKGIVAKWAAGVRVPVLVVCKQDENAVADTILKSGAGRDKPARELRSGPDATHGSSTLRSDKNPDGAEHYWKEVEGFLQGLPKE